MIIFYVFFPYIFCSYRNSIRCHLWIWGCTCFHLSYSIGIAISSSALLCIWIFHIDHRILPFFFLYSFLLLPLILFVPVDISIHETYFSSVATHLLLSFSLTDTSHYPLLIRPYSTIKGLIYIQIYLQAFLIGCIYFQRTYNIRKIFLLYMPYRLYILYLRLYTASF